MLYDQTEREVIWEGFEMAVLDLRGEEVDGSCVFL